MSDTFHKETVERLARINQIPLIHNLHLCYTPYKVRMRMLKDNHSLIIQYKPDRVQLDTHIHCNVWPLWYMYNVKADSWEDVINYPVVHTTNRGWSNRRLWSLTACKTFHYSFTCYSQWTNKMVVDHSSSLSEMLVKHVTFIYQ